MHHLNHELVRVAFPLSPSQVVVPPNHTENSRCCGRCNYAAYGKDGNQIPSRRPIPTIDVRHLKITLSSLLNFIPDYPRNTDIRAIFHGVMFLRISEFFFVFLYFERLYIFQDLNLEQTLPSIRKRDMPRVGIDPMTLRLRSQSTAIELSMFVRETGVNLLTNDAITLLVSNYLIWA